MLVAFEGMDGCGKSTVADLVAKKLSFRHEMQRVARELNASEGVFKSFVSTIRSSSNPKMGFMFYTFRCMYDKDLLEDTIVERSMASTYFFEHNKVSESEFDYAMTLNVVPDITFLLYASKEERIKRIIKRDPTDEDLKSAEALSEGYDIMLGFLNKYSVPHVVINTDNYPVNEVVEIASSIIKEYASLPIEKKISYLEEKNEEFGEAVKKNISEMRMRI